MLALALALAVSGVADWVPARWPSSDPNTLELLKDTPVNCLLMERPGWSREFSARAAASGIAVLGVVRPGADAAEVEREAKAADLAGLVLEGDFTNSARPKAPVVIELPPRASLRFDGPVVGTYQGVWPGVRIEQTAAATGGPWVDTNSGFLRYARAAAGDTPVWIAVTPPPNRVLKAEKYLQAISDAAIAGARWVIALDPNFSGRLLAREATALRDWRRIADHLRFCEQHRGWMRWAPYGRLAIVQDTPGAMYSGSILDMIATKNTPVRAVPVRRLGASALAGAKLAVNADPDAVTDEQKEALRAFTRAGGTLLVAPPGAKLPPPGKSDVTLPKEEVAKIDQVWKDINSMIGRSNLGVRLFNVAGMLSSLVGAPDGRSIALHLVNYTDYPVETVAVHLLGKYAKATLYEPGAQPRALETYAVEDGTGADIPQVGVAATVLWETGESSRSGGAR